MKIVPPSKPDRTPKGERVVLATRVTSDGKGYVVVRDGNEPAKRLKR